MVNINKVLDDSKGITMIEKMLIKHKSQLPEEKSINDFGGGYVEILKTKAKVVLYFGFTSSNNRVQIKFDINKTDILRWENAIAQKLWNKEEEASSIEKFDEEDELKFSVETTKEETVSQVVAEDENKVPFGN